MEIVRSSACKKCGACQVDPEEKVVIAHATNSAGAKTGDTVEVELNFEAVMSASLIVYIIPSLRFLGILIGFLGYASAQKDLKILLLRCWQGWFLLRLLILLSRSWIKKEDSAENII